MYSTFACALVLSGVPRIDWTSAFVMPIRMLLSFAEDSHPARRTPASKAKTRAILDFISQLLWGCRPGFTLSPERRGGILMDEKKVFPRGGTKWQDVLRLKRLCAGSIDRAKSAGKTRVFRPLPFPAIRCHGQLNPSPIPEEKPRPESPRKACIPDPGAEPGGDGIHAPRSDRPNRPHPGRALLVRTRPAFLRLALLVPKIAISFA